MGVGMTALAIAAALTVVAVAAVIRFRQALRARLRAAAIQDQRARHVEAQLETAADWAITAAVRAQLAEPVTDLSITRPLRVTTGDVIARAEADFNLRVSVVEAAAMLRRRLERRGHAGWPDLITDAYDHR
jgi:hypothetical protein